mmetsp:Transcript_137123/g.341809  ORF Transcript_137123/g.341809 Transcript_137123/m.341809 type:complete len:264 (-) Transcript_137123:1928-2719(-)
MTGWKRMTWLARVKLVPDAESCTDKRSTRPPSLTGPCWNCSITLWRTQMPPCKTLKLTPYSAKAAATLRLRSSHCTNKMIFASASLPSKSASSSRSRMILEPCLPHSTGAAAPKASGTSKRMTCLGLTGARHTGHFASRRATSSKHAQQPMCAQGKTQRSVGPTSSKQMGHFINSSLRAVLTVTSKKCTKRDRPSNVRKVFVASETALQALECASSTSRHNARPAREPRQVVRACSYAAVAEQLAPTAGGAGGVARRRCCLNG